MKKYLLLVSCLFLFGCSEEKVESKPSTEVVEEVVEDTKEIEVVKNDNDPWTHIDVDVSVEYQDLNFHVNKVVVSNEIESDNGKVKAIGTKWKTTNNSKEETYKSYLTLATLITSDGEQVKVSESDLVAGEFAPGTVKEGNLTFILEKSDVENLDWIKIVWNNTDSSSKLKETEMTINLK